MGCKGKKKGKDKDDKGKKGRIESPKPLTDQELSKVAGGAESDPLIAQCRGYRF